ncbi:MAG: hypothetical protein KDA20_13495, partial [Phycisphaerales bacterium]|nr:hypothetical protein [Phycisphaerales bacterium]
HLYGIERNDVDYIMDTFTVFKKRDEQANDGVYKTKQTILDIYDQMARAIETGEPWVSPLDPPPGPPADADGNFIPMAQWDRNNWPAHIHLPRDGAS